jgi:uncharacterized protein YfkK (UPF0435 family)
MKSVRLEHDQLPASLIQALADRDAALWVGQNVEDTKEGLEGLRQLVALPWKLVLCESNSPQLVEAFEAHNAAGQLLDRKRGFIHLVASDPQGIQLPPRALPVYLLNGRQHPREAGESANLGAFGGMRRRLNMVNELLAARPRVVLLLSNGADQPLTSFLELWKQEGFRALVLVLTTAPQDIERLDQWLLEPKGPPAVDHCRAPLAPAVSKLVEQFKVAYPETRLVIRTRDEPGTLSDLDVTDCELVERPLLDGYELVQSKDLWLLQPDELSREDFEGFFNRTKANWKPYAAGLPWKRGDDARKKLLDALKTVAEAGPPENRILSVISESGAGGTTFARMLAFEAASQGYPTLVARPTLTQPEALELSRFLHRAHVAAVEHGVAKIAQAADAKGEGDAFEVPWLIVFDVSHWEGKNLELRNFLTALVRDGRPVVILAVTSPFVPADLGKNSRVKQVASLTHELNLEEALQLGQHLNKFLRPLGQDRTDHQWRQFWEAHRPNHITSSIAHFWIALEFWLKGQLDLSQSIQSWLYTSFRNADIPDDLRLLLLEIATLSIERQPLPEGLMPLSPQHQYPYSALLDTVRTTVPALALVRDSMGDQKVWAMAHDLLGRYLITSTFFDRQMLERLGLSQATDPVQLRLLLLRNVATRSAIALKPYRRLALDFAVKILKLDAEGNAEFVPCWRSVLEILKAMPSGIRETSRTFNHHVAVSLRRVAKQREFGIDDAERKQLLETAIKHLEYALYELEPSADEESNLNLYNSLALAYLDLADLEREAMAAPDRIELLRTKASDAARKALQEDPANSYVLETTAKNLIQSGEIDPEKAVVSATEALGYIYQAVTLERSEFRQSELTRLANRALRLLRSAHANDQVQRLARSGNPLGTLAEAWMMLTEGISDLNEHDLAAMPPRNVSDALAVLEKSPDKSNWMLLRFRYDLVCASRPSDFAYQLRLLDELEGTGFRMPLQVQLEHAILLHEEGRHLEANGKFRTFRQDLRRFDAVVDVPSRLFWLRSGGGQGPRRICEAQVVESRGSKSVAKVRDLKDEFIPFVPQEFGVQAMKPGAKFMCSINFGRMGPFLKPPQPGVGEVH